MACKTMTMMRFTPRGYGGTRRDPDQVRRDGWHELGLLAVSVDDPRLSWPEREMVVQLGCKLYGPRASEGGHGDG
ncbi:hypothetical protein [Paracoccus kondratievae]|uniref:hypothetical protein n=1 Tax=Paracoccus kondratievae TaxID=135740 RepID=UPI0029D40F86|nr:hypothetical protein [Paracoccus kondratievae]